MTDPLSGLRETARAQADAARNTLAATLSTAGSVEQLLLAWARFKPQIDAVRRTYIGAMAAGAQGTLFDYFGFEARIIELVLDELDKKRGAAERKMIIDRLHDDYGEMLAELRTGGPATTALIKKLFPAGAREAPPIVMPAAPSPESAAAASETIAPSSSLSSSSSAPMETSTVAPSRGAVPGMPLSSGLPFVEGVSGAQEPTLRFPNPRRRGHDSDDDEPIVDEGAVVPVPSAPSRPGAKKKVEPSRSEIRGELSFDDSD